MSYNQPPPPYSSIEPPKQYYPPVAPPPPAAAFSVQQVQPYYSTQVPTAVVVQQQPGATIVVQQGHRHRRGLIRRVLSNPMRLPVNAVIVQQTQLPPITCQPQTTLVVYEGARVRCRSHGRIKIGF